MLIYHKYYSNLNADSRKVLYICVGNSSAQLNFIFMKKLIYYFLYPFNKLFDLFYDACLDYEDRLKLVDEDKVVYLVIGYYLNGDDFDICAVCDDRVLSDRFADDLRKLDKYFRVSVCDYTLNRLDII